MNKHLAAEVLTGLTCIAMISWPSRVLGQGEFLSLGESGGGIALFGVVGNSHYGVQSSAGVSHNGWADIGFHYAYTDGGNAGDNLNSMGISGDFHLTRLLAPNAPVVVASVGYATSHHNYSDEDVSGPTIGGGIYYRIMAAKTIVLIPFASINAIIADGTHGVGSAGINYAIRSSNAIVSANLSVGMSEDNTSVILGIGLTRANPYSRWR